MGDSDSFTEPGRHITHTGRIVYHWPPEGRFALLWHRIHAGFPDDKEKLEVAELLTKCRHESSTLLAYEEDGVWYDVEPNWEAPKEWLDGR